jgi:2-phospho-L-lactate guanylyltransferase
MRTPVVIPFKPINPKTRLSCILSQDEREMFAIAMLRDVIHAVRSAGCDPLILSTAGLTIGGEENIRVEILAEGLNEALDTFCIRSADPLAIIMADLALADRSSVIALMTSGSDMAIVPGRGGGTNAVYIRRADRFRARYYGGSFLKHREYAEESGLSCSIIDSFRLFTDIDEKEDLVEILLHNTGFARKFLINLGFSIDIRQSRIGVSRRPPAP